MTSERIDRKTPNGGDYAIAYYMDKNRASVSKTKATQAEIVEYKADGEIVFRTYMAIDNAPQN